MKKAYADLTVNEKINLKNNCGIGSRKLERFQYKSGRKSSRLWKGVGAMLILNKQNPGHSSIKNFNVPIDIQKSALMLIPTIRGFGS